HIPKPDFPQPFQISSSSCSDSEVVINKVPHLCSDLVFIDHGHKPWFPTRPPYQFQKTQLRKPRGRRELENYRLPQGWNGIPVHANNSLAKRSSVDVHQQLHIIRIENVCCIHSRRQIRDIPDVPPTRLCHDKCPETSSRLIVHLL